MIYSFEDIELDTGQRKLTRAGQSVDVEPQVFDVLIQLIENSERMLSKDELLETVWKGRYVSDSALSSRIKAARRAVGDNGRDQRIIRTVHGRGFQFVAEVSRHADESPSTKNNQPTVTSQDKLFFLLADVNKMAHHSANQASVISEVLQQFQPTLSTAIKVHQGVEVNPEDSLSIMAFTNANSAIRAAIDIHTALHNMDGSPLDIFPLRMVLHQGKSEQKNGVYSGSTLDAAKNLLSIISEGQIVATEDIYNTLKAPDLVGMMSYAGAFNLQKLGEHAHLYHVNQGQEIYNFRPLRAEMGLRTNLPRRRDQLIGRNDEVLTVLDKFNSSDLVSIVGPGGVGKTSLGLETGHLMLENHPGGVWLCELASVEAGQVSSAVLDSISQHRGSGQTQTTQIIERLSGEATLLVLDNCEHVVDEVAALAEDLIEQIPNLKILATSREALDVRGEKIQHILGLNHETSDSPAVTLFIQRATEITDIADDEETLATIQKITTRLEGLPLAIELAVPRLVSSSLDELLNALNDQLSVLQSRRRHRQHQSTMDRTIAWSYDLLSSDEQDLLIELSIFSGAFTDEAVAAISSRKSGVNNTLRRLVEKSMVVHNNTEQGTRYRLLEPIQQFVDRKLTDNNRDKLAECHAVYFAERVLFLASELRSINEASAAQNLNAEWTDFGQALLWGRQHKRAEIAIDPLLGIGFHLLWQLRREGFKWLEEGVKCIDDLHDRQAAIDLILSLSTWSNGEQARSEKLLNSSIQAQGSTLDTWMMKFYQVFVSNDQENSIHVTNDFWQQACNESSEFWLPIAASSRLIAQSMSNPHAAEIALLSEEVDRQIESTIYPTGHCWGLLSQLTKYVVSNESPERAEAVRSELDRTVRECSATWFSQTAGGLADKLRPEGKQPVEHLKTAIESLNTALQSEDILHLPLMTRAVVIWLGATKQNVVAAQVLGHISTLKQASSAFRQLTAEFDTAVEKLHEHFPADELEKLLSTGRKMSTKQVIDLCRSACEVALMQSEGVQNTAE